jgi:hypothetical protein
MHECVDFIDQNALELVHLLFQEIFGVISPDPTNKEEEKGDEGKREITLDFLQLQPGLRFLEINLGICMAL